MAKEKRIVATGHAIVSEGIGYPSRTLAPGEHVVFNEDNDTHKSIAQEIESGRETNLKIEEVDVSDEGTAEQPDTIDTDAILQAPARAIEQEVREAQVASAQEDAGQPEEAQEGAKEVQESVEAEQERQLEESGRAEESDDSSERPSGSSRRRGSRKDS